MSHPNSFIKSQTVSGFLSRVSQVSLSRPRFQSVEREYWIKKWCVLSIFAEFPRKVSRCCSAVQKWKMKSITDIRNQMRIYLDHSFAVACLKLLLLFLVAWITFQCCPTSFGVIRASASAASISVVANAENGPGRVVRTKYGNLRGFILPQQQQTGIDFIYFLYS